MCVPLASTDDAWDDISNTIRALLELKEAAEARAATLEARVQALEEAQVSRMRELIGWLSADVVALDDVEIPALDESLHRFLMVSGDVKS